MHVTLKLVGKTPLVQHNPQLLDPMNQIAREIKKYTEKRKKTDADYAEIAHLEFLGGLYYDASTGVYVPTNAVARCMERAGAISRQGTAINRAFIVTDVRVPLEYDGPREPEKLWRHGDGAFRWMTAVGVQRNKVMRMRPIFRKWSVTVEAEMLEDVLNLESFTEIVSLAGRAEGLLEARRLGNGRFDAEVIAS